MVTPTSNWPCVWSIKRNLGMSSILAWAKMKAERMNEHFTLEQRAAQIVLTAVSPYVVGIFTKRDSSESFWSNGSGSLVEFKGHKFVLTAAHVVPQLPSDIQFALPPEGGFKIAASLAGDTFRKSTRLNLGRCVGDHSLDVAALIFDEAPDLPFFDLSEKLVAPPIGNQVVLCGYPSSKERMVFDGDVRTCAGPDFQCAEVIPFLPPGKLLAHQFAVDYPSMPGITRPPGYSGSMVWFDTAGYRTFEELENSLELGAAGIITDHTPPQQALLATRIEDVIAFIKDDVIP